MFTWRAIPTARTVTTAPSRSGKTTPPHIPTTVQCSSCHNNTSVSFVTYTMNHTAVSASRCDSCHNGSYTAEGTKGAQGTASYSGHVATGGRDCVSCHASAAASFISWSGGTYVHQASDTNCSSCHNGTTATGMVTPPHIPSGTVQCSNCHTSTATSFTTYTMSHSVVSGSRCDACHNGAYTAEGTKGAYGTASYAGHVATSGRDCITCHASAAAAFTSWAGGTYVHQAADTNCTSCHNGTTATGLTTPPHIPTGTIQCSNCHTNTATSFTTYTMSHTAVTSIRCDACHNGSYKTRRHEGCASEAERPSQGHAGLRLLPYEHDELGVAPVARNLHDHGGDSAGGRVGHRRDQGGIEADRGPSHRRYPQCRQPGPSPSCRRRRGRPGRRSPRAPRMCGRRQARNRRSRAAPRCSARRPLERRARSLCGHPALCSDSPAFTGSVKPSGPDPMMSPSRLTRMLPLGVTATRSAPPAALTTRTPVLRSGLLAAGDRRPRRDPVARRRDGHTKSRFVCRDHDPDGCDAAGGVLVTGARFAGLVRSPSLRQALIPPTAPSVSNLPNSIAGHQALQPGIRPRLALPERGSITPGRAAGARTATTEEMRSASRPSM